MNQSVTSTTSSNRRHGGIAAATAAVGAIATNKSASAAPGLAASRQSWRNGRNSIWPRSQPAGD